MGNFLADNALQSAVETFPIESWLYEQGFDFRDNGSDNIYCDCRICGEKAKLGVSRIKKLFHCFKCDDGAYGAMWRGCKNPGRANLIQFIALTENISRGQAIQKVLKASGIASRPSKHVTRPIHNVPTEAMPMAKVAKDHPSIKMMVKRGLTHLIPKAYVCLDGKYTHRVILPCNFLGQVEGFEAKAYAGQRPKALYPSWFSTSHSLYTTRWDHSLDTAIVTESIFDAETIGLNAIGLYGSSLSDGQLSKLLELKNLGIKRLVWFLDLDAWEKQTKIILHKTSSFFENYTVRSYGKDPNDCGRIGCSEVLENIYPIQDEFDFLDLSSSWERSLWEEKVIYS